MNAWTVIATVLAGGIGAGARYVVDVLVGRASGTTGRFPVGILVVNVSGSFALGIVTGLGVAVLGPWVTILGIGLLGGYTTFSTVSVETVLLAEERRLGSALANLFATLALALAAAVGGFALAAALVGTGG